MTAWGSGVCCYILAMSRLLLAVCALSLLLASAAAAAPQTKWIAAPNGGIYYYKLPAGYHQIARVHLAGFTEPTAVERGKVRFTVAERFYGDNVSSRLVKKLFPTAQIIPSPKLWDVSFRAFRLKDGRLGYLFTVSPYQIVVLCRGASTQACRTFTLSIQTAVA